MHVFMFHLAIVPAILLLLFVVCRNKGKSNPTGMLLLLALGGVLSIIPAMIVEVAGYVIVGLLVDTDSTAYNFIISFFVVATIEELGKLGFLFIFSWTNRNFDHSYDGVIYAVCSSMGFAVVENILYVFSYGMGTGIFRAFTAVPLHCACGVVMGFYYARARERANEKRNGSAAGSVALAYLIPLGMHGLYDFMALVGTLVGTIAVIACIILAMLITVFYAAQTNHVIRRDPVWTNPYSFGRLPMYPRFQQTQYTYGYAQHQYAPQAYGQQVYYSQGYVQAGCTRQPFVTPVMQQGGCAGQPFVAPVMQQGGCAGQPFVASVMQQGGCAGQPFVAPVMQQGGYARPSAVPQGSCMGQPFVQPQAGYIAEPVTSPQRGVYTEPPAAQASSVNDHDSGNAGGIYQNGMNWQSR